MVCLVICLPQSKLLGKWDGGWCWYAQRPSLLRLFYLSDLPKEALLDSSRETGGILFICDDWLLSFLGTVDSCVGWPSDPCIQIAGISCMLLPFPARLWQLARPWSFCFCFHPFTTSNCYYLQIHALKKLQVMHSLSRKIKKVAPSRNKHNILIYIFLDLYNMYYMSISVNTVLEHVPPH